MTGTFKEGPYKGQRWLGPSVRNERYRKLREYLSEAARQERPSERAMRLSQTEEQRERWLERVASLRPCESCGREFHPQGMRGATVTWNASRFCSFLCSEDRDE